LFIFTIKEYLNENFSSFSNEDLVAHFITKFGVNVSVEDDLYLFKYNQISANWNEKLTHECRGIILRHSGNEWKYVSIPFYKFFNLGEGKCPWFTDDAFAKIANDVVYAEKIDGSCIQLWYDDVKNEWRASTLGSISTANVFDHPFTFSDLFWKIFNASGNNIPVLKIGYTYIFELWSIYNQVVTHYSENSVVLLGVRNNETFALDDFHVEEVVREFKGVKAPKLFSLDHIKTPSDLHIWVEEMALNEDLFGKVPEGFVAWYSGVPIFKEKNTKYSQYHHLITGDSVFVLKNIIAAVFHGNIDDIYGDLNADLQSYVDRLKTQIAYIQNKVISSFKFFKDIPKDDKKAYAMKLQELSNSGVILNEISPFYYQNRERILNGENVDISEWYVKNDCYLKFLQKWKAL